MKFVPAVKNKGRKRGGEETMKTWNGGVSLSRGVGSKAELGLSEQSDCSLSVVYSCLPFGIGNKTRGRVTIGIRSIGMHSLVFQVKRWDTD